MVKHTQTIRRLLPSNCLSVFDHFVGLALKGLKTLGLQSIKGTVKQIEKALINDRLRVSKVS